MSASEHQDQHDVSRRATNNTYKASNSSSNSLSTLSAILNRLLLHASCIHMPINMPTYAHHQILHITKTETKIHVLKTKWT